MKERDLSAPWDTPTDADSRAAPPDFLASSPARDPALADALEAVRADVCAWCAAALLARHPEAMAGHRPTREARARQRFDRLVRLLHASARTGSSEGLRQWQAANPRSLATDAHADTGPTEGRRGREALDPRDREIEILAEALARHLRSDGAQALLAHLALAAVRPLPAEVLTYTGGERGPVEP